MNSEPCTSFKIVRTGFPPLVFVGQLIGKGTNQRLNSTRWTSVLIYRTAAWKIVCVRENHSQWEGESSRISGNVFATPAEVVADLQKDCGEHDEAAQNALEAASAEDTEFAEAYGERIP